MRQWVVLSLLLAIPPDALAAEGKVASSRELLRMGFFQDFEELDIAELLESADVLLHVAGVGDETAEAAPGVVSVLTDEDMRQRGVRTLGQALELIPSVDVTTDGLGRPRVVMRGVFSGATGGGSEDVLILINGHRIDDPFLGGATLLSPSLPVANVRRIEVLRGAGSAVFGSGAVAGVVDIVTYGPEEFSGIEGSVEAGSFGTQRYGIRLGSRAGEFRTFGFLQFEDTNGPRLAVPADSQSGKASLAPGRTSDGLQSIETNYRIEWRDFTMNLRVGNTRADGFIGLSDALGDNDLSYRQILVDVAHERRTADSGVFRTKLTFADNRYQQFLQPLPPHFRVPSQSGEFDRGVFVEQNAYSRRFGIEGEWERELGDHRLFAGLSLGRESAQDVEVISNYDFETGLGLEGFEALPGAGGDDDRTLFALFVRDQWRAGERAAVTAGLRFDQVGDVSSLSPRLGAVFTLPNDVRLKLLYGRSFRAPTLAERELSVPLIVAEPDLDPVRIDTLEAAVAVKRRALRASVSGYLSYLRDAIEPIGVFDPARSRAIRNGPGTNLRGLELELRRSLGKSDSVFVSLAVQHAEDRRTGQDAPYVPGALGSVGGTVFFKGGKLSATPVWSFRTSRDREPGDARAPLAGHGLLGLTLRAPDVYRSLSLTLSGRNLLDQGYGEPAVLGGVPGDYPRPGRSVLLQATYLF
ncbi:MAG TPA: TonB-dependent receptor [Vicinamibacteria bacterium]|nr:TonB-dependent receptor [Vicinamibacteria bacterium]